MKRGGIEEAEWHGWPGFRCWLHCRNSGMPPWTPGTAGKTSAPPGWPCARDTEPWSLGVAKPVGQWRRERGLHVAVERPGDVAIGADQERTEAGPVGVVASEFGGD